VRTQNCTRILEIGTHFGGSGLSMLKGVAEQGNANVVSIDITDLNPALHATPGFTKLTGDANSEAMIRKRS
jgi:cephalosporin hydroxylase